MRCSEIFKEYNKHGSPVSGTSGDGKRVSSGLVLGLKKQPTKKKMIITTDYKNNNP